MLIISNEELLHRKAVFPWFAFDPILPTNVFDFKPNYQRSIDALYLSLTNRYPTEAIGFDDNLDTLIKTGNWPI